MRHGRLRRSYGEAIRRLRVEHGMTRADLADLIHTSHQRIWELENHGANARLDSVLDYAKALGTTPSKLLLLAERIVSEEPSP